MQKALLYLASTLLKRRLLLYCRELRRPLNFLSLLVASTVLGIIFYFRNEEFIGKFVQNTPLAFFLSLLLIVSLVRSFMQRGLHFNPSEIEFLFSSPFQQSDLIIYRLIPAYLGSIVTLILFPALFWSHFDHPILTAIGVTLFQIVCAHLALAASIFSGSLSDKLFARLRWIGWTLLAAYAVMWIDHAIKSARGISSTTTQTSAWSELLPLLFFPHFTSNTPPNYGLIGYCSSGLVHWLVNMPQSSLAIIASYFILFPALAATLFRLLHLKTSIIESSLALSDRSMTQTIITSIHSQQSKVRPSKPFNRSVSLPKWQAFTGSFGALIWKNLLCALRSKTRLLLSAAYTFAVTASIATVAIAIGKPDPETAFEHYCLIPILLSSLPFLLHTALPFDLRLDGRLLSNLRILPVPTLALASALISIPTIFCLVHQAAALLVITFITDFPPSILLGMIFGFPAITASVQIVWNIYYAGSEHYLLANTDGKSNAIGTFLVLCITGLLLWPGGYLIRLHVLSGTLETGLILAIAFQYSVNAALLIILSKMLERNSGSLVSS